MAKVDYIPEIVAPAGSLEKVYTAGLYGADAVYVGGSRYGLRTGADNLSDSELKKALLYTRQRGMRLYVVLNAFLHDSDLDGLEDYCQFLQESGVSAVIVSDRGVLERVKKSSSISLHISTQASVENAYAAYAWRELGAKRVVVGRELSVYEAAQLSHDAGIEVEMFVHGAMCSSYSGQCTISNYTAGRDSNRGGCKQSCRFPYQIAGAKNPESLISSKDLCGIDTLERFCRSGIRALKIEGRMKSELYVAVTCSAYRRVLGALLKGEGEQMALEHAHRELDKIPHRDYTEASLKVPAGQDSIYYANAQVNEVSQLYAGIVVHAENGEIWLRLKNSLQAGEGLELLQPDGTVCAWIIDSLRDFRGRVKDKAHGSEVVRISTPAQNVQPGWVARKQEAVAL